MNFLIKLFKGMYHFFALPKPGIKEEVEVAVCDFGTDDKYVMGIDYARRVDEQE